MSSIAFASKAGMTKTRRWGGLLKVEVEADGEVRDEGWEMGDDDDDEMTKG